MQNWTLQRTCCQLAVALLCWGVGLGVTLAAPSSQPSSRPAAATPARSAPPPATQRAKAPLPPVSCGLSDAEKKQKRRLMAVGRIADLPGLIAGLSWATHKGWLKQLSVQRLQSIQGFLQGRMIKLLGLQWQQGIWVSVYERTDNTKTLPTPFAWMPTHRKGIKWGLATKALSQLEINVAVDIKKTYWLSVALRRLLGLTGRSIYSAQISGYKTHWLQLNKGVAAVLVVTSSQLLVRFLWQDQGISDVAGRQQRWQMGVGSIIDAFQSKSFLQAKQRITSNYPVNTQGLAFVRPRVVCRWLKPLPFPEKRRVLQALASVEVYSAGGRLSPKEARADQRIWFPKGASQPGGPIVTAKPPAIDAWLPATARWVTTIDTTKFPIHQLYELFSPPPKQSFYGKLQRALAQVLRAKGLAPAGVWLWQESWRQWSIEALMMRQLASWMESPAITADMQRKHRGLLATGTWAPGAKPLIHAALQKIPGAKMLGVFGQTPTYQISDPQRGSVAISWAGNRWFSANHLGLLQRIVRDYKNKTKGSLLRFTPSGSLLHLQSWNKGWNIMSLNPARVGCLWQPGMKDKGAKWIAKHIERVEVAALTTKRQRSVALRLGWKQGGLLPPKEAYKSCWGGEEWWRRLGMIAWSIPLRAPLLQFLRPFALPYLTRIKKAIKHRKLKLPNQRLRP